MNTIEAKRWGACVDAIAILERIVVYSECDLEEGRWYKVRLDED